MEYRSGQTSVNTVLLVIILLIVVGFGVWWFTARNNAPTTQSENPGINVDVNLPGNSASGSDQGTGSGYGY